MRDSREPLLSGAWDHGVAWFALASGHCKLVAMNDRIIGWGGGAVVALAVTGVTAFVAAIVALFALNLVATGVCLAAAAIAFSGIANVIFRG